MRILHSNSFTSDELRCELSELLAGVSVSQLRHWVEEISRPRHYRSEPERNQATADWLINRLEGFGFVVELQGEFTNLVARPKTDLTNVVLVGAHYDSIPKSPGADDNASAVAALLGCAEMCAKWDLHFPVVFVAFNREEDDLLGSRDFVESYLPTAPFRVTCAHVLEMVGYASPEPGSQSVPTGLPIELSPIGNFLGLLANSQSGLQLERVLRSARSYVPQLPATGLEVPAGFEKLMPVLARSDHVPFWTHAIPAVMWTDTAEFRNPNYHRTTDTPDTLDYNFLRQVTQTLIATVISDRELVTPVASQ